jgi:hypothetical protein
MFTNRMMSVAARGVSVGAVVGSAAAGAPVFSNTLGDPGFAGSYVAALAAHDDGSGPSLYATGQFSVAGVPGTANLARWNGTAWESVGGGLTGAFSNTLTTFQGDLIAGGYFDLAGGVPGTAKLARWDGVQWNSMDAQSEIFLNSVWDLEVWDDGSGERLYVAGNYVDIGGVGGPDHLAVWDGVSYAPLGAPIGGAVPLIVLDLQVADLGDGERLFAGGRFLTIDGVPANNIAVWDGAAWSALDSGLVRTSGFAQVLTMAVFDDGSGDALFVGGRFDLAGGAPASRIAKWDGVGLVRRRRRVHQRCPGTDRLRRRVGPGALRRGQLRGRGRRDRPHREVERRRRGNRSARARTTMSSALSSSTRARAMRSTSRGRSRRRAGSAPIESSRSCRRAILGAMTRTSPNRSACSTSPMFRPSSARS